MKTGHPKATLLLALLSTSFVPLRAQHVVDPRASLVDVARCQEVLRSTTDPLLLAAKKELNAGSPSPFVPPPAGRMIIPAHYLSGSSGPTNPAEAAATRPYEAFERAITLGVAQFLASGDHGASSRVLDQLDAWAKAGALLDYSRAESQQAWFQVEWTLSSAGVTDSVLVNDLSLDAAKQHRVTSWLVAACRRNLSFEKPGDTGNNHLYWRALAAMSIGVTASDEALFRHAVEVYKKAIDEIDPNGAFPKEMARHENAIHYQGFALQPLVTIAQFAARQGYDLYGYQAHGRTLRDAILFFGRAVDDPNLVTPYTSDTQSTHFGRGDFAPFAFYAARFGPDGLPSSLCKALRQPLSTSRVGYTTLMVAGAADRKGPSAPP